MERFQHDRGGYIVERSLDRIVWAEVTTRPSNATTYTHTGLSDATTYYYRVRAKASSGAASQPSTTRSAVTKPGRVNTLTMRTYTLEGGAIVLYWDDIDGETQYRILRQDGSGAFLEIGISGANVPIYIDASPKSTTTTYSYKIETVHPSGATTSSSAVSVATRSTSRPSPFVQNVPAPGTIPLDWANISMGSYSPDEYRIYRRDPMTEWALRTTVTSSAFTDTNVVPGTSYTYQVVGCTTAAPRVCSAAGTVTASPL